MRTATDDGLGIMAGVIEGSYSGKRDGPKRNIKKKDEKERWNKRKLARSPEEPPSVAWIGKRRGN